MLGRFFSIEKIARIVGTPLLVYFRKKAKKKNSVPHGSHLIVSDGHIYYHTVHSVVAHLQKLYYY